MTDSYLGLIFDSNLRRIDLVQNQQALAAQGYPLDRIFKAAGWNRVALWGGGKVGVWLYELLHGSDIEVVSIIDNNSQLDFPYNVDIITPDKMAEYMEEGDKSLADKIDAIISTPICTPNKFWPIFMQARRMFTGDIINLSTFLVHPAWIARYRQVVQHISNSGAKFIHLGLENTIAKIKNASLLEKSHLNNGSSTSFDVLYPLMRALYDDIPYLSTRYLTELMTGLPLRETNGLTVIADKRGDYLNVVNGLRITTDQPESFSHTIHLYGPCYIFGYTHEDRHTVASQLQRLLISNPLFGETWRVVNRAVWGKEIEHPSYSRILHTDFNSGDICLMVDHYPTNCLDYIETGEHRFEARQDVSWAFDRPHDYGEVFRDATHFNHRGAALLAKAIYKILATDNNLELTESMVVAGTGHQARNKAMTPLVDKYLSEYISYLTSIKETVSGRIGSVVMNCNPFTIGHKYLIETAAAQVDWLYVFCIEEDMSLFSFTERYVLLQTETRKLENVKILRGGKLIISAITFPEYFMKETSNTTSFSSSLDIELFGEHIAPALGITVRFAGTEPSCYVTRSYNQAMREKLPKYGVGFIEIERQKITDSPISASTVRKLMSEGDIQAIGALVPSATMELIQKKMAENNRNPQTKENS